MCGTSILSAAYETVRILDCALHANTMTCTRKLTSQAPVLPCSEADVPYSMLLADGISSPCIHECMYVCMYECMHMCIYYALAVCTFMCLCVYVCMYVFMYVCMYVCTDVCVFYCTCMYRLQHPSCQVHRAEYLCIYIYI